MLSACDLDAPNLSTMSEDVVFATEELANAAVMGMHQSFGETNSYRGRFIPYFGTNTDCEIFNNYCSESIDRTQDKEASLACYSAQVDNTYMNNATNAWAKLYEAVERANKAIESIEIFGNISSNANMGQLYGEILTLRAMIYFDMTKAWGDVPYRFEPIKSETLYLPQSDLGVTLRKCMDDLELAEKYLGWPNENSYTKSTERVSKAFAKGLRARIALFLAGVSADWTSTATTYVERKNWEQSGYTQSELWTIALDECKDIINQGCNKLGAFEDNFRALSLENTAAGKESLYEIPFSSARGRVLYTWGGKHTNIDDWTKLAKGGVNGPTPTLWYDYDPQDVRRNITCLPYVWTDGNKTVTGSSGGGWSFGKLRFEWMTRVVTSTNDDGINWQVMRLADVYMMAAEAANELGQDGSSYIKPVLDRAYPVAKVSELLSAASGHDAFFNLIVNERKLEFAGEAIRKVDLIRWGLLKEKLDETKANMQALAERSGKYASYPKKVYYNVGLDAEKTDADNYTIYGLESGNTDDEGSALGLEKSSQLFCLYAAEEIPSSTEDEKKNKDYTSNNNKINNMINEIYVPGVDPRSRMFWPIWSIFVNGSNGQLVNHFGY